jgi:hypothetical protein
MRCCRLLLRRRAASRAGPCCCYAVDVPRCGRISCTSLKRQCTNNLKSVIAKFMFTATGEQIPAKLQKGARQLGQSCAGQMAQLPASGGNKAPRDIAKFALMRLRAMTSHDARSGALHPSPPSSTNIDSCNSSTSCALCRSTSSISCRNSQQTSSKRGSSHSLISFNSGMSFRSRSRKRS